MALTVVSECMRAIVADCASHEWMVSSSAVGGRKGSSAGVAEPVSGV